MDRMKLRGLIDGAAGREKADLVINNCKIVDVYSGTIVKGNIAIRDGLIVGIGDYEGETEVDAKGAFAMPGLIDGHVHIESAFVTPEEFGKLVVPKGTTTVIADPHEIVNVCGVNGFEYMLDAAKGTDLDIKYQVPSCVPATPFESSGATFGSATIKTLMTIDAAFGLGEMMNFPGVIHKDDEVIAKILEAKRMNKVIDGHAPGVAGKELNAYVAAGIKTDHECFTVKEMTEKIGLGMYILLRQGSASQNLQGLLKGATAENSRRLVFCTDDKQPKDIMERGSIDEHLRISVEEGIDPVTAIRMGTLNTAECYGLTDRGAIAPGLRGDIVLVNNLKDFKVKKVFIEGKLVAEGKKYVGKSEVASSLKVRDSINIRDFPVERFNLNSKSDKVKVIEIVEGEIITKSEVAKVTIDDTGDFVFNPKKDIVKIVVVERHHGTGKIGVGLLKGYGLKQGAVAQTIAHDSHNIVAVGVNNNEIVAAIGEIRAAGGGAVVVRDGKAIDTMSLPIAGLMSEQKGELVAKELERIQKVLHDDFGVNPKIEPLMTLSFMALPVIPELKITDLGLFDVTKFDFTNIEAD